MGIPEDDFDLGWECRWQCWSCKEGVSMSERSEADGDCPNCGAELDLALWPNHQTPRV